MKAASIVSKTLEKGKKIQLRKTEVEGKMPKPSMRLNGKIREQKKIK